MMSILAKIISHGFAVAVVALLAVGFIYRGDLFPEMQLPDFLSPDSETVAESEGDAGAGVDEPAAVVGAGAAIEQAEAAGEEPMVTVTGDAEPEGEAPVAAMAGDIRPAEEAAGTAPMAESGVAKPPSADVEEAVEEVAELAGQVIRPADTGMPAPAVTATVVPEPQPVDTAAPELIEPVETAPAVADTVEIAAGAVKPAEALSRDVAPEAGMSVAPSEPAPAAPVESPLETTAPAEGLPEAIASEAREAGAEALPVPAADTGQEPVPSPMQQQTVEPVKPDTPTDTPTAPVLAAEEAEAVTKVPATEAPEMVATAAPATSSAAATGTHPYQLLASAREAYWLHDYDRAESIYRELTVLEPDNPDWYGELGNMFFSLGKWDESASAYFEAGTRLVRAGRLARASELVNVIRGLDGSQAQELEKIIHDVDESANQ
ncbi:MAG: hypothetical protein HKM88_08010 [Halobacteria archaeon]|nr:hypothetical protein [Halobacteria archaeon]